MLNVKEMFPDFFLETVNWKTSFLPFFLLSFLLPSLPPSLLRKTISLQSGYFSRSSICKRARWLASSPSFSPSFQDILLLWPASSLNSLKGKGLEIREAITAKGLNKGGLAVASSVTGTSREKSARGGHLPISSSLTGNLRDDIGSLVSSKLGEAHHVGHVNEM